MKKKCKQNRNMPVWVVPYTRVGREAMKEDSFGYDEREIYG